MCSLQKLRIQIKNSHSSFNKILILNAQNVKRSSTRSRDLRKQQSKAQTIQNFQEYTYHQRERSYIEEDIGAGLQIPFLDVTNGDNHGNTILKSHSFDQDPSALAMAIK